jgi:hypothetical protein
MDQIAQKDCSARHQPLYNAPHLGGMEGVIEDISYKAHGKRPATAEEEEEEGEKENVWSRGRKRDERWRLGLPLGWCTWRQGQRRRGRELENREEEEAEREQKGDNIGKGQISKGQIGRRGERMDGRREKERRREDEEVEVFGAERISRWQPLLARWRDAVIQPIPANCCPFARGITTHYQSLHTPG